MTTPIQDVSVVDPADTVESRDEELVRTGVVDSALFEDLRRACADPQLGPRWVQSRLVPLVTRLYFGLQITLHDPWRSAPTRTSSNEELQSWIERYFVGAFTPPPPRPGSA